jgi:hypothetical protein
MRIAVLFLICIVVGIAIGWYLGNEHQAVMENSLVMQESEDDCAMAAVVSMAAVRLIHTNETQKAVQLLSNQIAQYYYLYAIHSGTNEDRSKLFRQINELIITNKTVADEITNQMVNYQIRGKLPNY